jgi:putative transposase
MSGVTTIHLLRLAQLSPGSLVAALFKSLKAELIWREKWPTQRQAEAAISQYIKGFCNTRRRLSYLGSITPLAFEAKAA